MAPSFRQLNYLLSGLSLLLLLLSLWLPEWPKAVELGIFIGLMVLTGIPHGATDHLVFQQLFPHLRPKAFWLRFLGQYLSLIVIYALFWWWLPLFSLGVFLLFSFYHFGQSELFFLPLPESNWMKKSLYLSWGGSILLLILYAHLEDSLVILSNLHEANWLEASLLEQWVPLTLGGLMGCTLLGLCWVGIRFPKARKDLLLELGMTLLLILLIQTSSLLLAFAVYFGLWHAGKTIWMEVTLLQQEQPGFSLGHWIKAAIPFSLISFVGIGGLLFASQWEGLPLHPVLLFFILISLLTLPHMSLLGALYRKV